MKKEEIHWADWHRILFGTAPEHFLLEVLLRTAIIYLFLLITLRLLGKRMGGQLSITELAVMLTLGAIVAVPMQVPDKGLLQGILVLICALVFQRGINYLSIKSNRIERLTQGEESLMVRNGVIVADQLSKLRISREQMLAVLRNQQIYNLGEVKRVYLEACGLFSVFKYQEPRPGLSLIPVADEGGAQDFTIVEEVTVCHECGNGADTEVRGLCDNCGADNWVYAIISK